MELSFFFFYVITIYEQNSKHNNNLSSIIFLFQGQSPRLLALGFMIVTSFLSMWISNTATAAMIVPIVDAVVKELTKVMIGNIGVKSRAEEIK